MAKRSTWILVADASRARLFRVERCESMLQPGQHETKLAPVWDHQLAGPNVPSRAIASDRPGRTFDRAGQGRHAKEPPTDPARHAKKRFAQVVVERLDGERKRRAFDRLVLVAPPQFLGDLRAEMSAQLGQLVTAEVDKDLSRLKPHELLAHLGDTIKA